MSQEIHSGADSHKTPSSENASTLVGKVVCVHEAVHMNNVSLIYCFHCYSLQVFFKDIISSVDNSW